MLFQTKNEGERTLFQTKNEGKKQSKSWKSKVKRSKGLSLDFYYNFKRGAPYLKMSGAGEGRMCCTGCPERLSGIHSA